MTTFDITNSILQLSHITPTTSWLFTDEGGSSISKDRTYPNPYFPDPRRSLPSRFITPRSQNDSPSIADIVPSRMIGTSTKSRVMGRGVNNPIYTKYTPTPPLLPPQNLVTSYDDEIHDEVNTKKSVSSFNRNRLNELGGVIDKEETFHDQTLNINIKDSIYDDSIATKSDSSILFNATNVMPIRNDHIPIPSTELIDEHNIL